MKSFQNIFGLDVETSNLVKTLKNPLFRGTKKCPEQLFREGEFAKKCGSNISKFAHSLALDNSSYISTSKDLQVAEKFGIMDLKEDAPSEGYVMVLEGDGLNLPDFDSYNLVETYKNPLVDSEKEVLVEDKIPPENIVAVRKIWYDYSENWKDEWGGVRRENWIFNPYYKK